MTEAHSEQLPTELAALVESILDGGDHLQPAVGALAQLGIHTPLDLHFARSIAPHSDLPNSTITHLRALANDNLVAPHCSAKELLTEQTALDGGASSRLGSCLAPLDRLLGGGYPARRVIQIAGPPQSFRTVFLFHAALNHLLQNQQATCCWIDTRGTFNRDVTRTVAIIKTLADGWRRQGREFRTEAGEQLSDDQVVAATLERLLISVRIEREGTLETIATCVRESTEKRRVSLVVIDSVDTILSTESSPQTRAQAHANQVDFVRRLSDFTRDPQHPITIFVVNSAVEQPLAGASISVLPNPTRGPGLQPALGTTFAYLPDLTLWMTRGEKAWGRTGDGTAVVEVVANRGGRSGEWVAFKTDGVHIQALE